MSIWRRAQPNGVKGNNLTNPQVVVSDLFIVKDLELNLSFKYNENIKPKV